MKRWICLTVVCVALVVVGFSGPAHAAAISTLVNTGVDASHTSLPNGTVGDTHYSLVSVPSGASSSTLIGTTAAGVFPLNGAYVIGDSATSAWIGPDSII